jgi:hypothetical protein
MPYCWKSEILQQHLEKVSHIEFEQTMWNGLLLREGWGCFVILSFLAYLIFMFIEEITFMVLRKPGFIMD